MQVQSQNRVQDSFLLALNSVIIVLARFQDTICNTWIKQNKKIIIIQCTTEVHVWIIVEDILHASFC